MPLFQLHFKQTNPNWRTVENENREIIRKGIFSIGSVWRCLFEIVIHPPPIPFEFYSQDFHFPLFNWIEIDSWFSQDENYENIVYNSYYQVEIDKKTFSFFYEKDIITFSGCPFTWHFWRSSSTHLAMSGSKWRVDLWSCLGRWPTKQENYG